MNKDIDISKVVLKTKRLTLRPFRQDDLDDFFEYAKVDGVGQMAGWLPHESKNITQIILDKFIEGKHTFALELNGKVIGSLGIEKYDEYLLPEYKNLWGREIGYVLSKDYWGQGLMPEAVKEVIKYLFDVEKLDFITCGYYTFNSRSKRVQEKCGFKYLKSHRRKTSYGTYEDGVCNILTRQDYKFGDFILWKLISGGRF